jgi:hypothetical protein
MSASTIHAEALLGVPFPSGIDTHWETENRTTWNERERTSEERELVYEVSWISELGVWRRFLRSQRSVSRRPENYVEKY